MDKETITAADVATVDATEIVKESRFKDTRAERAVAAAQVPTRQQRIDALMKKFTGIHWQRDEEVDGSVKLWMENADGDRMSGRGEDLEAALKDLEAKFNG